MNAINRNPQLREDLRNLFRQAYDHGFRVGYAEGAQYPGRKRDIDRALGVGFVIGTGVGVILAIAAAGWLQ